LLLKGRKGMDMADILLAKRNLGINKTLLEEAQDIFGGEIQELKTEPLDESLKILSEIQAQEQAEPTIIITVWNGNLDDVESNVPLNVIVLEHDSHTDIPVHFKEWVNFGGYDYGVRKWEVKATPQAIADVVAEVGI